MKVPSSRQAVGVLAVLLILGAIVSGIVVLGSPEEARVRRFDDRRVQDLAGVSRAADLYWTRHGELAAALDRLIAEPGASLSGRDPRTGEPYEYRTVGRGAYEVCATFERDSEGEGRRASGDFWLHGTGRQCFQREPKQVR